MEAVASLRIRWDYRCYYRPVTLAAWGAIILFTFWFASRYPALLAKSRHVGNAIPSMAFDVAVVPAGAASTIAARVAASSANWLVAMAIGMSFGVLFGALLHTVLRYYPLKIGTNLYLNSLKGALVGAPMGVCANCAVPMACGVTRGHGRIELALGYLFSSPNFNPVVVMMTFAAFPWYFGAVKYLAVSLVILLLVPMLVSRLERSGDLKVLTAGTGESCELPTSKTDCDESFWDVLREIAGSYAGNVWMLLKPTLTVMMLASVLAALALNLVPWPALLSRLTWPRALLASFLSVFMPVPIALDVMFAAQLHQGGIAPGYVMLFLVTLGTYSIIPSIYLWREVSKKLSVSLFFFFWMLGFSCALLF